MAKRSTNRRTSSRRTKRTTSTRRRASSRRPPRRRTLALLKKLWAWAKHIAAQEQTKDIGGVVLVFAALLTLLAQLSLQQGRLLEPWVTLLARAFGWGAYVIPLIIGAVGVRILLRHIEYIRWPDTAQTVGLGLGFVTALATYHFIAHLLRPEADLYTLGPKGGWVGATMVHLSIRALGPVGAASLLLILWITVITLVADVTLAEAIRALSSPRPTASALPSEKPAPPTEPSASPPPMPQPPPSREAKAEPPAIHVASRPANGDVEIDIPPVGSQHWRLPAIRDILEPGGEQDYNEALIREQVRIIEETLESLGAPVLVREINQGPVITQFGVEPLFLTARNGKRTRVKVSKIANLADDLALALSARSIRIQAPIPGRGLVGIEIPNEEPALVSLLDTMESRGFNSLKGRLRLAMGQDVSGQAVAADLRRMPHLLIAGATGSGKSVCVNAIIAALLLQNTPETLRLLLVDPKRVELTQYNGIPHLLTPVIVNVERVVPALKGVMKEMDRRYREFAQAGARNIEEYNRRIVKMGSGSPIPYIVVVIDELADLMMQSPEEAERAICRLAQMARATGIHLIIATQRPSVDVVTGLIKANFPARVAFAVTSSVDSRVILDMPGAERLLGRGDMLFMPPEAAQPVRLQGAFVSDRELGRLIGYWRNAKAVSPSEAPAPTVMLEQPTLFPEFDDLAASTSRFEDAMLPEAVRVFLEENRASVSLLQRRLRIGYTRSARLVETLTEMGIVSEERQGQSRQVNREAAEALLASLGDSAPSPVQTEGA